MSRPGCTVEGCSNDAAFKILHDDRLADQYRCFECIIDHLALHLDDGRAGP